MRKGLLGTVAAALVGTGTALAQAPAYLPGPAAASPGYASVIADSPVLLPAQPDAPAPAAPAPGLTGGSTGLRPGVDCLPDPGDVGRKSPRLYGDVAYLPTWIKNGPRNFPLAIVTPALGTGAGFAPGTLFFGGNDIDYGTQDGIRGTAGVWLDRQARFGVEAGGFLLERGADGFGLTHDGSATNPVILARPLIAVATGQIVTIPIGLPGVSAGSILVSSTSRLWGADGDFVWNFRDCRPLRIDLLAGFRYLDLLEKLDVTQVSNLGLTSGAAFTVADSFDTRNQFYGGQVGSRAVLTRGRLSLALTSKLALGFTHEVVDRVGATSSNLPGVTAGVPGGLLVQASNAGRDTRDRFAVLPEATIQLGYRLTEHLDAFIGYNFLYVSSVARPGDQIDPVISLAALGTAGARPAGGITGSDFYAHSALAGVGYRW
jgi:hypothetical protein